MKHIYIALGGLFAALVSGCLSTNTGLVAVDTDIAKENGIEITRFEDNPFFAHIYYDYKDIEDFDVSKLKVTLKYTPVETTTPDLLDYFSYFSDNTGWLRMETYSYSGAPAKWHWTERPAEIVSSEPGHLKILAIDDIGSYAITYND